MPMTPEEALDAQALGESISDENMAEVLEILAWREAQFLDGPLGEGEDREIVLHNAAVLAAAAARLRTLGAPSP